MLCFYSLQIGCWVFLFCFFYPGRHNITMANSALQIKKLLKKVLLKITLPQSLWLLSAIHTEKIRNATVYYQDSLWSYLLTEVNLTCNLSIYFIYFESIFFFFLIQVFVCLSDILECLNTRLEEINNFLSCNVLSLCMQIVKYILFFFSNLKLNKLCSGNKWLVFLM